MWMMRESTFSVGSDWIDKEFATVDFCDDRLTNRFFEVAKDLASNPEKPIGQACETKAAVKGAYRLFGNDNFDPSEILTSHFSETTKRMSDQKIILAIHDTSQIKFNGHKKTAGVGGLNRKHTDGDRSIFFHPTLALTTEGLPLGLLSYKCLTRTLRDNEGRIAQRLKRANKNLSERESIRWINGLEETASNIDLRKHHIVNIADRECDSYAFMVSAIQKETSFIVRSKGDRTVEFSDGKFDKIKIVLNKAETRKTIKLTVPKNKGQDERTIRASVKYIQSTIDVPRVTKKLDVITDLIPVPVYIVQVKEIDSSHKNPIEWILITSLSIESVGDALKIVEWYKLRWAIEIYFKILKSGCRVEECRLQSFEKLDRYIALMSVIAFRIFYLSKISRTNPDEKCTAILSELEWKALFIRANRSNKLPSIVPSIDEATTMIARLGGYLARKTDPPPGPIVIWRGWAVLSEAIETLKIMNNLV
jgi:hypothetical protein